MKVLIADRFEVVGIEGLEGLGCEVIVDPHLSDDALSAAVAEQQPEVLVVRSTKVTDATVAASPSLALIVRAGAGVNTIDVDAAARNGVYVANCPGMNAAAVAELVFGLMISLDRRIAHNVNELREGVWNKQEYSKARGLKGSTLGIIGLGRVGQEVAARGSAFEMRVVYSDVVQHVEAEERYGLEKLSLEDLLRQSDYITLHVTLVPATRHLINEERLRLMKPSAHVINTSRGAVVDETALSRALQEGWIAGAGLDVFEGEPTTGRGEFVDPVVQFKDLYGTHHIGAATAQAQTAVATETVRIIKAYIETGHAPNCVNTTAQSNASHMLVVRHVNKPGILAHILSHLTAGNINVEEMNNIVFKGAETCCAHIQLDGAATTEMIERINGHDAILSTKLVTIAGGEGGG